MTAPALARTLPDGTRAYVNPLTGEREPSITTIMKVLNKPALEGWSSRVGGEYADKNWDELTSLDSAERIRRIKTAYLNVARDAADVGTTVHEICERFATGEPSVISKRADPYVTQFIGFLADVKPVFLGNEVTVWSRKYGYAGTADAFAIINDEITVVDWKTGKGIYPEHGLQLAALSHADFIITPEGIELPIPEVARHAVVHLRPRSWKLVPVREVEACFNAFLACKSLHYWQNNVAVNVLEGR